MLPTDAPANQSVVPEADQLPDDVALLRRMVLELLATLQTRDRELAGVRHRLELLLRRLCGPRGERYDPNQPLLFAEMAASPDTGAAAPPAPTAEGPPKRRCRSHERRRLPDELRREPRHHELTEAERVCPECGRLRVDIGLDKSKQLDYRPASLFIIEHFVHKYACPCCSQRPSPARRQQPDPSWEPEPMPLPEPPASPQPVEREATSTATDTSPALSSGSAEPTSPGQRPEPSTAPAGAGESVPVVLAASKPPMPIAKGLPGPGLLAHLIVSKYVDHLPLHRLERVYERQGLFLHRSTLCDWLAACADLLRPLYDLLVSVVLQSWALHTDDTTVKMQELGTHLLSMARFWVYLGDAAHPYNVFDFTVNRKRDGPQQFLANYQGYLQADAFSGYDGLYLPDPRTAAARIIEVACNAHARRKFYEARGSDALRSHEALAYYRQLYELERAAKEFSDEQRLQMRQDLAMPTLEQFRRWLDAQRPEVLPKSPIGEAIGYALNNWVALVRYTEAGFLTIDNNVSEREMKRIAIGRKNWLSVGSPRGAGRRRCCSASRPRANGWASSHGRICKTC